MDYDTYVYFCSEFGCNAFLFKELGVGIFTLHELTYQITILGKYKIVTAVWREIF